MAAMNLCALLYLRLKLIYVHHRRRRLEMMKQAERRFWVREIYSKRDEKGEFNILVKELQLRDHAGPRVLFKMFPNVANQV